MHELEDLVRSTELLLDALSSGDELELAAACAKREESLAALSATVEAERPFPTRQATARLRDLHEELLAKATDARDAAAAELREVRALRRGAGRMRAAPGARFIDSRV